MNNIAECARALMNNPTRARALASDIMVNMLVDRYFDDGSDPEDYFDVVLNRFGEDLFYEAMQQSDDSLDPDRLEQDVTIVQGVMMSKQRTIIDEAYRSISEKESLPRH